MRMKRGDVRAHHSCQSYGVVGQERRVPPARHSRSTQRRKLSRWTRKAIKPAVLANYDRHMGHVANDQWPIAARLTVEHDREQRSFFFLRVRLGYSQQLNTSVFIWMEEYLNQRFSFYPYQRGAGTGWVWALTIHACRETSPSFY